MCGYGDKNIIGKKRKNIIITTYVYSNNHNLTHTMSIIKMDAYSKV